MGFEDTVRMTAEWYRAYYGSAGNIRECTENQIAAYMQLAHEQGMRWAR